MIDISVIIPAWNRAGVIGEAIGSVAGAYDGSHEIIVVDDGSDDGTGDVAERSGATVLRNGARLGAAAARNRGFAASSGRFVVFLDSDDLLGRDALAFQKRALERSGADVGYCMTLVEEGDSAQIICPIDHWRWLFSGQSLPIHSLMVRRDAFEPFDEQASFEDYAWVSGMLMRGLSFHMTDNACVLYRRIPRLKPVEHIRDKLKILSAFKSYVETVDKSLASALPHGATTFMADTRPYMLRERLDFLALAAGLRRKCGKGDFYYDAASWTCMKRLGLSGHPGFPEGEREGIRMWLAKVSAMERKLHPETCLPVVEHAFGLPLAKKLAACRIARRKAEEQAIAVAKIIHAS